MKHPFFLLSFSSPISFPPTSALLHTLLPSFSTTSPHTNSTFLPLLQSSSSPTSTLPSLLTSYHIYPPFIYTLLSHLSSYHINPPFTSAHLPPLPFFHFCFPQLLSFSTAYLLLLL